MRWACLNLGVHFTKTSEVFLSQDAACFAFYYVHVFFASVSCRCVCVCVCVCVCYYTSVMQRLLPQDACEVLGPGLLHLPAGGLQGVGVLGLPPPEPDLETQTAAAAVVGHAQVRGLGRKTRSRVHKAS